MLLVSETTALQARGFLPVSTMSRPALLNRTATYHSWAGKSMDLVHIPACASWKLLATPSVLSKHQCLHTTWRFAGDGTTYRSLFCPLLDHPLRLQIFGAILIQNSSFRRTGIASQVVQCSRKSFWSLSDSRSNFLNACQHFSKF